MKKQNSYYLEIMALAAAAFGGTGPIKDPEPYSVPLRRGKITSHLRISVVSDLARRGSKGRKLARKLNDKAVERAAVKSLDRAHQRKFLPHRGSVFVA